MQFDSEALRAQKQEMNKHGHFPLFVSSKPRCHAEF